MRSLSRHLIIGLAAGLILGCGTDSGPSNSSADAKSIALAPDVRIGSSFGDTLQLFENIMAVDVDTTGAVYIADAGAAHINVMSTNGELLHRIGRRGAGPGEFKTLRSMTVAGDRVAVFDEGLLRVSIFNRVTGKLESTFGIEKATSGGFMGNGAGMHFSSDSSIVLGVQIAPKLPNDSSVDELREYSVSGQILRTQRVRVRQPALHRFPSVSGREFGLDLPFTPWTIWTINPRGGATVAWGGNYSISELSATGDTSRIVLRENTEARSIDSVSLRLAERWADGMLAGFGATPAAMKYSLPDSQQQVVGLSYSPDGQFLWVKRTDFSPDPTYDVFEAGTFKCSVTLLAGGYRANLKQKPIKVTRGMALEVAIDSLGNNYVLGYYLNTPKFSKCGG